VEKKMLLYTPKSAPVLDIENFWLFLFIFWHGNGTVFHRLEYILHITS